MYKRQEEKFFQIDPLKAPFVVEAFQRYNDGATMKELMNWLNDSGVTTNRNQKFTYNSVQTLLTNKRYIGENRFKDIVMPDSIPAIGCSCTNPAVTEANPYYFRVCFLDPFQMCIRDRCFGRCRSGMSWRTAPFGIVCRGQPVCRPVF